MDKKIVELIIEDIESAGVDIISFVENPAIELPFIAFSEDDLDERGEEIIAHLSKPEVGIQLTENDVIIDPSQEQFETIGDYLKGIIGLDILGKRKIKKDERGVEVYRYAGPIAERGFCKAMLRLNKIYRPEELSRLDSANPGQGPRGANSYDVFKYKGGVNCRHYWEKLLMFKSDDGRSTTFISQGPATGLAGKSNNNTQQSPDGAVARNARLFSSTLAFSEDDQRIATGPAMVPNMNIIRRDEVGNPYWVYFSEETIAQIAEKVFQENKHNNTNVNHEGLDQSNTLIESWIVEDREKDKAAALGFDVPKGTWMVSYRVNNDETWNAIKEGKLKGFSVEGHFMDKAKAVNEDDQLQRILDILDKTSEE